MWSERRSRPCWVLARHAGWCSRPGRPRPQPHHSRGAVGPGETIAVSPGTKKAGTYKLTVQDRSDEHNFRLRGPGVNVATAVGATGKKTFTVKLRPGKTYTFLCDPHSDEMRGAFKTRT